MQKKQSLVEYLLIVSLIAFGTTGAMTLVGKSEAKVFNTAGNAIEEGIANAKKEELAYKNKENVNNFQNQVSNGSIADVPASGNNGSSSWKNPNSPSTNQPPVALFDTDPSTVINSNTKITFLNLSTDPDGDKIVKEEWVNKKETYPKGTHTVKLRVADEKGNWSAWYQKNIVVTNGKPVIRSITMNPNTKTILPDTQVSFNADAYDPDGQTLTYIWTNKLTTYALGPQKVTLVVKDSEGLESEPYTLDFEVVQIPSGVYKNCAQIKSLYPVANSGTFSIKTQAGVFSVYCDMETDGGGWMRIANYEYGKTPQPAGLTIRDDAYWTSFTTIAAGNYQWKSLSFNDSVKAEYSNVKIEHDFVSYSTLDSWSNTHNSGLPDRSTVEGQYVDGISVTYGNAGYRKHILSYAPSDYKTDPNGAARVPFVGNDYVSSKTANGVFKKTIPTTTEKIEVRLMNDQYYPDEDVGFKKLNIWIK